MENFKLFIRSYWQALVVLICDLLMIPFLFISSPYALLGIGISASIALLFKKSLPSMTVIAFILLFTALSFKLSAVLEFKNAIPISFSYVVMIIITSCGLFVAQTICNIQTIKEETF